MPLANPKNFALSPAATELGLGDMLMLQLETETEERRKEALRRRREEVTGAAASELFGGYSGG
jgi:hypothetical protein